ncbi:MAG: twin-arginine translocation signal domain-containing protein [Gemmataceae bacterium]
MQRRDFLKSSAASAGALALPNVLHADDKSGSKNPIIGQGEHRYECQHDWGQLPKELRWETTHGICVDAAGLIYIKHLGHGSTPLDTIVVFDPDGKFVRSFGKEYYRGGHGIDVRKEGNEEFLYLSDVHNRQVVKTNLKGEEVWKRSYPKEANVYKDEKGYKPTNVAFAPDGGFYVGDGYGSHYIHQYDKDAKWVRTWGGAGKAPGKMQTPHGLWLDDRPGRTPSLVVADRANARLQYFTLDGKHIGFVNDVLFPAHFDIKGEVLLVPDLHARVSLFDKDNKPIVHLGDDADWIAEVKKFKVRSDPKSWRAGKFVHPHDACFDKAGNIFVVEWVQTGRVTKLKKVT